MNALNISRFPQLGYAGKEAINTLCTNLSFSGEHVRKIMITSCHAAEGKTFISMNVMRTLARYGKQVVLVDADLRRSMVTSKYGLEFPAGANNPGLAHLLAGMASENDVLYSTGIANAYMVPVGREVSNPLPLLNSPKFRQLLDNLAKDFQYVLVDSPPVGTVIDAAEIAKSCDGTLLVVNYNAVSRQELIESKEQIDQTGCPILGTVLNMTEFDSYLSKRYYYKSYYSHYDKYYGYGPKSKSSKKASKGKKT